MDQTIIETFSALWYNKGQLHLDAEGVKEVLTTTYNGYLIQKNPLDLWIYQEILHQRRPDLIIEMGTASGASALFLAHQMDNMKIAGKIVTVDIDNRLGIVPQHPRITYLVGDSISLDVMMDIERVMRRKPHRKVMVILDDDHSADHVLKELNLYAQFVSRGQYLIVEDTNVDTYLGRSNGPLVAVNKWLETSKDFTVDRSREKFLMTWNPGGFLLRN